MERREGIGYRAKETGKGILIGGAIIGGVIWIIAVIATGG